MRVNWTQRGDVMWYDVGGKFVQVVWNRFCAIIFQILNNFYTNIDATNRKTERKTEKEKQKQRNFDYI